MAGHSSIPSPIDESARRQYEAAWRDGRPVSLDSFLPNPNDPRFLATLEELVCIEMEFVWKAGSADLKSPGPDRVRLPRVESYRGFIFATLNPDAPSLLDYLGPITRPIDEWLDRHPND